MFLAEMFDEAPRVKVKKKRKVKEADGPLTYKNYPCTKDCSGHIAGDGWAEAHGVTHPNQCPYGSSNSFWEGCKSQAEINLKQGTQ